LSDFTPSARPNADRSAMPPPQLELRLSSGVILGVSLMLVVLASGVVFLALLASDGDTYKLAGSGFVALAALAGMIALHYVAPGHQRLAAQRNAEVEVANLFLNRSVDYWDDFFRQRREAGQAVTADDVSKAVESLMANGERILSRLSSQQTADGRQAAGLRPQAQIPAYRPSFSDRTLIARKY
jgi:hypothetical protein